MSTQRQGRLIISVLAVGIVAASAGPLASAAESSDVGAPSVSEIEAAIDALSAPVDPEALNKIFVDLGFVEDPAEQQRLQEQLDQRIQALMEPESVPAGDLAIGSEATEATPVPQMTDEELRVRIQAIRLGRDASAQDLRDRDEVFAAIIAIEDPVKRDEFLQLLEARERDAETVVYRASEPATRQ